MKQHYELLIVGATALAVGIAQANKSQSIAVIEPGFTVAPEFSAAMKTSPLTSPKSEAANELLNEMKQREAIFEDGEWLPAVSPILAKRLLDSGADCYFFAMPTKIEKSEDKYNISFTAYGVESSFTASRVIDTTSEFLTRSFFGADKINAGYNLNYFTADSNRKITRRSLPCPDGDIASARLSLIEGRSDSDKLIMIASELDVSPEVYDSDIWKPSAAYGNFLEAYDAGISLEIPEAASETIIPEPISDGEYDVVVVGLGTAGAVAAIAAAKEGLRVLGIESLYQQGGSGTAGGVLGYYYGYKGGLYQEIDKTAHSFDSSFHATGGVGAGQKAAALDSYTRVSGVDCRFGATFTGVIRDGDKVCGIRYTHEGEPHIVKAKFVIDCTAESSVCMAAGCKMQGGRLSDNRFQPYSHVLFRTNGANFGMSYIDNGVVNQYDPDDFGENILKSATSYIHLRQSYASRDYLGIAPLIGLREGYKIVGEENVSFEELIAGNYTDKPVYYGWSNLDNHGKDSALEDRIYQDWITICGLWGYGVAMPIPMGALIPKDIDGLLAAGRNVAIEHNLATGLRMKDDCQKSGETAAKLAAIAIKQGIRAKEVDYFELREKLLETKCLKPEDRMRLERQKSDEVHELPLWCSDDKILAEGIASNAPGYFMWSAKTLVKSDLLKSLLKSDDTQTRWHAALTLSLFDKADIGDEFDNLTDILIECAESRDGFIPETGRKYLNFRSVSAICALGRIKAAKAVPSLTRMLLNDSFIDELPFTPYDFMIDREDLRFQYSSHIITALCDIARENGSIKDEIKSQLTDYIDNHSFEVSLMNTVGFKLDCKPTLKKLVDEL
jgi:hypothetical protein